MSGDLAAIVGLIANDEALLRQIMRIVHKRISKNSRSDRKWCQKVIELTVSEILEQKNLKALVQSVSIHKLEPLNSDESFHSTISDHPSFSETEPNQIGERCRQKVYSAKYKPPELLKHKNFGDKCQQRTAIEDLNVTCDEHAHENLGGTQDCVSVATRESDIDTVPMIHDAAMDQSYDSTNISQPPQVDDQSQPAQDGDDVGHQQLFDSGDEYLSNRTALLTEDISPRYESDTVETSHHRQDDKDNYADDYTNDRHQYIDNYQQDLIDQSGRVTDECNYGDHDFEDNDNSNDDRDDNDASDFVLLQHQQQQQQQQQFNDDDNDNDCNYEPDNDNEYEDDFDCTDQHTDNSPARANHHDHHQHHNQHQATAPGPVNNYDDKIFKLKFVEGVVSHVQHIPRYTGEEVARLFYSHEEAKRFEDDYFGELTRSEALGMRWTEWVEARTDDDVEREENSEQYHAARFDNHNINSDNGFDCGDDYVNDDEDDDDNF